MKANELRIGNWVYDEFKKKDIQTNGSFLFVPEILKPIALTDEWLFKFGFAFNEWNQVWYMSERYFKIDAIDGAYQFNDDLIIDSVHQLQNLYFALIGEELTEKKEGSNG